MSRGIEEEIFGHYAGRLKTHWRKFDLSNLLWWSVSLEGSAESNSFGWYSFAHKIYWFFTFSVHLSLWENVFLRVIWTKWIINQNMKTNLRLPSVKACVLMCSLQSWQVCLYITKALMCATDNLPAILLTRLTCRTHIQISLHIIKHVSCARCSD